jgi:hypothetical protein
MIGGMGPRFKSALVSPLLRLPERGRRPLDGTSCGLNAAKYLPSMPEEDRSRFRKAHTTRRPHEQRRSQFILQSADLAAHSGLGDMELLSSTADVPLFGHGDEVLDLGKAHAASVPRSGGAEHLGSRKIQTVLDAAFPPGIS